MESLRIMVLQSEQAGQTREQREPWDVSREQPTGGAPASFENLTNQKHFFSESNTLMFLSLDQ